MINYKEIFEAWKIAKNPTPIQEKLANERLNVCKTCEFRKEVLKGVKWSAYCGDCGCPLSKKIFSQMFNPCTQQKWNEVDMKYMNLYSDKKDDTII